MNTHATFFAQRCPTCGRQLRISIEYLGKSIQCRHCRAVFPAVDPAMHPDPRDPLDPLIQRADELLAQSETINLMGGLPQS